MTMMQHNAATGFDLSPVRLVQRLNGFAGHIPLALTQTLGRIGLASLFYRSAQSKLASWDVTLQLFEYEYAVPVLPTHVAASLATAVELGGACLILAGLATRLSALALLGVVATIQLFVFPGNWGEHSLWAALLILLVARGAGPLSLDRGLSYIMDKRS